MKYEEGQRVSLTLTGTVISEEEFADRAADAVNSAGPLKARDTTLVLLDNGILTKIDTTSDNYGSELKDAKPKYWPPVIDDLWKSGDISWYATKVDYGRGPVTRMVMYSALGDVLRSRSQFLKENPKAKLVVRNGEIIAD